MTIFNRLLGRSDGGGRADPPPGEAGSGDEHQLPFPGYDKLDAREIGARLPELSQVELAAVESYEQSHKRRGPVLSKLRYMRTSEPLPGYDSLSPDQIAEGLVGADKQTIKAVRDYERKFGKRPQVMHETARLLPISPASAGEERTREQQKALVREGFADRAKTAGGVANRRPSQPDKGRSPEK